MSAYPLNVLLEENKTYGFAIWQVLSSLTYAETRGIDNQPQASCYDPSRPQAVEMYWGSKDLPCDQYTWSAHVTIDPTTDFLDQPVLLKHTAFTLHCGDEHFLQSDTYKTKLRNLLHIIPLLDREKPGTILGCLDLGETEEYIYTTEELDADGITFPTT